jgi:ATP-dependent Clp protease ATP-binding subunit ClpC
MGEIYPEEDSQQFNQNRNSNNKRPSLVALDAYGVNISKLAAEGKLDPVVGREDEILRVVQILGRRRKNNPVLVGEPGVGKTAIVEGLALRIIEGNVPSSLQGKTIYTLELSTIVAGTKYRGQFEERMKAIVEELVANPHVIIFIDEIHTLVGAGGSSGSLDASNIIKPALARGEIRCIGATTFDEFRETIEEDGALDRRFQKVVVEPPSLEETETILLNIRHKYESYHSVSYSDEIISLIVKLADNYIIDRYFPDKAVDIMDEVGSYKHLIDMKVPKKIKQLEEKLIKREKLKKASVLKQDYELAAKERDACVAIKAQIESEYATWKKSIAEHKMEVTDDDVLKVVSKSTGIPIERITDKENKNLLGINEHLSSCVIGQREAIDKVSITIQRNRIGIRKRDRTAGNFIFLGPTGVGKTQLAKEIAEYMFNSEDNLIRIDMSEYMEPHSVSKLIGSPPGYVGHESGGFLTEQVKRKPHSVVLFDEVEKAHPDVFNILLQMLDDGYLTDSLGRTIDFRNCLVILTSNTGARQVNDFGQGVGFKTEDTLARREEAEKEILMKALNRKFSPEFLNRIDEIIIFNKLNKDDIMKILDNECNDLADNLFEVNEYGFKIAKPAKDLIIEQGYDPKFGARPLRRALERLVENPIAEMILRGEIKQGDTIKVTAVKGVIKIDVQ